MQNKDDNPFAPPSSGGSFDTNSLAESKSRLPSRIVDMFAFIFSWFVIAPLLPIISNRIPVTFLAFQFYLNRHPAVWVHLLSGLLAFAAIVGIAILFRHRAAYDVAFYYCVTAIAAALIFHSAASGRSVSWIIAAVQYPMLAWFTWHVTCNRRQWRQQFQAKDR